MNKEKFLLTTKEVADLFRVNPRTIQRWANLGLIPYIRTPGGHRRYPKNEIMNLLKLKKVSPNA